MILLKCLCFLDLFHQYFGFCFRQRGAYGKKVSFGIDRACRVLLGISENIIGTGSGTNRERINSNPLIRYLTFSYGFVLPNHSLIHQEYQVVRKVMATTLPLQARNIRFTPLCRASIL